MFMCPLSRLPPGQFWQLIPNYDGGRLERSQLQTLERVHPPLPHSKKADRTVADVAFIVLKCCEALATASIAPHRFSCFSSWTSVLCQLAFRWLSFSCHPKCTKFSSEVGAVFGGRGFLCRCAGPPLFSWTQQK